MKRKEVVIGASGVLLAIIALVAIVLVWTTVDNLGKKADAIEQRLAAIENKTWHTVGDFTLSPSKTSEGFHIQGEEWRLTFTFNAVDGAFIGYNLRVYDANGNIVGGLSGIELVDIRDSGKGILNIREGQGDYTVEVRGMTGDFTFSFTVEEFY
jgi:membrane protein implicated in regulation of membrane protease activity